MSTSLVFRPVEPPKYKTLPYELKFIFKDKFELDNGTARVDVSFIPYLEGISDASTEDIKKGIMSLIESIKKYGAVDIWLQG